MSNARRSGAGSHPATQYQIEDEGLRAAKYLDSHFDTVARAQLAPDIAPP